MSDVPGPFRWKLNEDEEEKKYYPYRRRTQPPPSGHRVATETCIDLSNKTKAAKKSFPVQQGGTNHEENSSSSLRSSTVSATSQQGSFWAVPVASKTISSLVVRQRNVPSYEATSSSSSGRKTSRNTHMETIKVSALGSATSTTSTERYYENNLSYPSYEQVATITHTATASTTVKNVTNHYSTDSDSDSLASTISSRDADTRKSSSDSDTDSLDSTISLRDADTRKNSEDQKDSSFDNADDESAERFGAFIASYLKRLNSVERVKVQQKIFECLVKTESTNNDEENTKNEVTNKNDDEESNEGFMNTDSLAFPQQYKTPMWHQPQPRLDEQEQQYQPQKYPFNPFWMQESRPSPFFQQIGYPQSTTQFKRPPIQSNLPFNQSLIPYSPYSMHHLYMSNYMPKTSGQYYNYNSNNNSENLGSTHSEMAAATGAHMYGQPSWMQSVPNPVPKPQGSSTQVPPPPPPQQTYTHDNAGQVNSNDTKPSPGSSNPSNFDRKY